MESLFLAMFAACSAGILIFLASVFRRRDSMAPGALRHDSFLEAQADSPWPKTAQVLGLEVQVDEPEVLLCRHVLQGDFRGRLVRVQSFDRKHAGRAGLPSAVRVGVKQGMPGLGLSLASGARVEKVHGVASVCFLGDRFLGDGLLLGKKARPIRRDGPWIELDGLCDPAALEPWLEEALQVFSEMERAHHAPWVQAAQDHDLRLEWEREQRLPRLAGLVRGVGVRVSWMEGGGARITLFGGDGRQELPAQFADLVSIQQGKDGAVLTLSQAGTPQLSSILSAAFAGL